MIGYLTHDKLVTKYDGRKKNSDRYVFCIYTVCVHFCIIIDFLVTYFSNITNVVIVLSDIDGPEIFLYGMWIDRC